MRILLDISVLGLGHVFPEMRGGTFRVHEHLAEGLARSGECELFLCANYSSVAFVGCAEYVQSSAALCALPLLGPGAGADGAIAGSGGRGSGVGRRVGRVARTVHRAMRPLFRGRVIPAFLRDLAQGVDRKLHPPVSDAPPRVDVFHSLGARLPPAPAAHGRRPSPRRLVNIYDLAPLRLPHLYGDNQRFLARERIAGLQREDWVITTSEATRADLAELGGVDPDRVFVVPLAADPRIFHPCREPSRIETLRHRLKIHGVPYLLALNAHEPRKNMDAAIRAFGRAVAEGGARDLALVIAGPASAEPGIRSALAEAANRHARVILTGYVSDEDLATLYGGALAFVFPSLCEGFGLPPLEAMQCGAPVIAGRVASLPEVVADAGILLDLDDPGALCEAMLRLYRDAALRDRLSALSLRRAAAFSWDRCTRQTLAAYRVVTAGHHAS